jgi:hypothetical protein
LENQDHGEHDSGAQSILNIARMAEQEDAVDSKSTARKGVRVRLSLRAPENYKGFGEQPNPFFI